MHEEELRRTLADDHPDTELLAIFADNDASASEYSKARRPQFEALFDEIEAYSHPLPLDLWTTEVPRLFRRLDDAGNTDSVHKLVRLAKTTKLERVRTTGMGGGGEVFSLDSPDGYHGLMAAVNNARHESAKLSQRQRRKHRKMAEEGRYIGRRPFGYQACWLNPDTGERVPVRPPRTPDAQWVRSLTPDPVEAPIVRAAVQHILNGGSVRGLNLDWNRRGIRTAAGGEWNHGEIPRLLANPRNAGLRQHRAGAAGTGALWQIGELSEANWEAIVDRQDWEDVRRVLVNPARQPINVGVRAHLLTGFLRCGKCGAPLSGGRGNSHASAKNRNATPKTYYGCPAAPRGCGGVTRQSEALEGYVVRTVLHWLQDSSLLDASLAARRSTKVEIAPLRDDRDQLEQDKARAFQDYRDRVLTAGEYGAIRDDCDARMKRLDAETTSRVSRAATVLAAHGDALVRHWKYWETDGTVGLLERRRVMAAVIDHIVVKPTGRGRLQFDPASVEIVPTDWVAEVLTPAQRLLPYKRTRMVREDVFEYVQQHRNEDLQPSKIAAAIGREDAAKVNRALGELEDRGLVIKTQQGAGRRPHLYRYAGSARRAS